MRQRHPIADAGRSEFFAFGDFVEDLFSVKTELGSCPVRKLSQQVTLIACTNIEHHMGRRKEVAYLRGVFSGGSNSHGYVHE